MATGSRIKPEEIGLFVAINGGHPSESLGGALMEERENHGRSIGVVILEEGRLSVVSTGTVTCLSAAATSLAFAVRDSVQPNGRN